VSFPPHFTKHRIELCVTHLDLWVSEASVVRVIEGANAGHAWLIDPLLEGADVRKFSGSDKAGCNVSDLVGKSCDAFAHYALYDSEGTILPADIQGKSERILSQ
jgi:Alpha-kinase family